MQIKMKQAKNVYGERVPKGSVLIVGADIPAWQADKFLETNVATEFVAQHVASKKTKGAK